jgi:two-component system sensor kinase FixL
MDFQTRHLDFSSNHYAVLAASTSLVLVIALVQWPHGWLGLLYLIPVVLASRVLSGWYLAAAGALSLVLAQAFAYHPSIPQPAMVLLIVSVFGLAVQAEHSYRERRYRDQFHAARKQQQEWRTFFQNSPAAVLTVDGDGRILMANPAAHVLLGFEGRPLIGQALGSCLPALASALRIERVNHVSYTITECKAWRADGKMFIADAWFSIDKTELGTRLAAVIVDASERLQERERRGLRSAMSTSQIAMGAVLHEIRNLSAAATLMHTNLQRVPRLKNNEDFEALGNLVKALANITSAELRPGEGSITSVDLHTVLDQLRIIIETWFHESEISIHWDIAKELPSVWVEESGLLQIFLNLAQNSHKAMSLSERKLLTISANLEGGLVIVRFRDTGPGITAPDELFRPFQRSTGMKGLGLYVSRAIAHSFSAELRYEPTPAGSSWVVELLPLKALEKVPAGYANTTPDHQDSSC